MEGKKLQLKGKVLVRFDNYGVEFEECDADGNNNIDHFLRSMVSLAVGEYGAEAVKKMIDIKQ